MINALIKRWGAWRHMQYTDIIHHIGKKHMMNAYVCCELYSTHANHTLIITHRHSFPQPKHNKSSRGPPSTEILFQNKAVHSIFCRTVIQKAKVTRMATESRHFSACISTRAKVGLSPLCMSTVPCVTLNERLGIVIRLLDTMLS